MGAEKFTEFFSNAWTVFVFILDMCAKIGGFGIFVMLLSMMVSQRKELEKLGEDMDSFEKSKLQKTPVAPKCFVCDKSLEALPRVCSEVPPLSDGETPEVLCGVCFSKHFAKKNSKPHFL